MQSDWAIPKLCKAEINCQYKIRGGPFLTRRLRFMIIILIAGAASWISALLMPFAPPLSFAGIAACLIVILSTILDEQNFFMSQPNAEQPQALEKRNGVNLEPVDTANDDSITFPPQPALPTANQESSASPARSS